MTRFTHPARKGSARTRHPRTRLAATATTATAALTALAGLTVATALTALSGCAADPAPPPLVTEEEAEKELERLAETTESATSTSERPARVEVSVGVDPVRAGFNPHLAADEQATVRSIADLVLPSAFVDGERNPDLLLAATRLPSSSKAATVRYVIDPEAQWSDGTPISGADFIYLWRAMRTTPGTINAYGYDAIADIRVSGPSGKTVDVDFRTPIRDIRGLFTHLLPSHLLAADASDFATALHDSIPASAGRFLFSGVDRGRGTITLNRNDRFWGPAPARIDILNLQPARTTTQTADQLRSGQIAFVDMAPDETTHRVLELVPDTQVLTTDGPRTLGVTLTAGVTFEARQELASLIDAPLLASIATNRSTDLALPSAVTPAGAAPAGAAPAALPSDASTSGASTSGASTSSEPTSSESGIAGGALEAYIAKQGALRVAADAADPAAAAAGKTFVDQLNAAGIEAKFVGTDNNTIMGKLLPAGAIDAVFGWRVSDAALAASKATNATNATSATNPNDTSSSTSTSRVASPANPESITEIAGRAACPAHAFRAANLSGYCSSGTEQLAADVLAGTTSVQDAVAIFAQIEAAEALWVPIVTETRVAALGQGIEGPDPNLKNWDGGLATAPTWRVTTPANAGKKEPLAQ
ncbi:putative monoacyl phosphatidylinositol tetramannoside-binding protein LpqW precursor [Corynebacterium glaucum]|uniref:ABC transporter family substrate-binding protein n=1 Tax=Corynebacterium glaucum TaxID=187491 RepID=UPI0025B53299|nr:ABC transporter family substrate-binding protein [Corynebacterium glaucum]WJZ07444.1 putative monoacyl phosphatidylinositol tetramannoside-binding protein LpqW precursor [Corynebacterium glaucum]